MKDIVLFVIAFLAPFLYYRTLFFLARNFFDTPTKTKSGMQIHHLHYGIVFIFVAAILLLFAGENMWTILFLGSGLGLVGDEFIGSLRLPEHRPTGLLLYRNSFKETVLLFSIISVALLILGVAFLR